MQPRMQTKFQEEILPKVSEQFGIKNVHALPKLDKIVLNFGMGKELDGTKLRAGVKEQVLGDIRAITGQNGLMISSRKSVSNFKTRVGYETHAMVTLRGARMWEFYDRLVSLAIPRVKDFRGVPDKSFDKAGNYSLGIKEQGIFPEVDMTRAKYTHGMNINIVFKGSDADKSRFMLKEMGMPFVRPDEN